MHHSSLADTYAKTPRRATHLEPALAHRMAPVACVLPQVGIVPVLRGGLGMVESMTEMVSGAQVQKVAELRLARWPTELRMSRIPFHTGSLS